MNAPKTREQMDRHNARRRARRALTTVVPTDDYRICTKCECLKALEGNFRPHSKGFRSVCRACDARYTAEYQAADPERTKEQQARSRELNKESVAAKARERYRRPGNAERARALARITHYKNKYGITPSDYERMIEDQDGRCAICRSAAPGSSTKHFAVDHCHTTGAVRGLLCSHCNKALGGFRDSADLLAAAILYLTPPVEKVA